MDIPIGGVMKPASASKVGVMLSVIASLFTLSLVACGTVQPGKTTNDALSQAAHCPSGRIVTDPFGYPECVTPVQTQRAPPLETGPKPQEPGSRIPAAEIQAKERRAGDDLACRQYSETSLSVAYLVYRQCMEDKGWPSTPP